MHSLCILEIPSYSDHYCALSTSYIFQEKPLNKKVEEPSTKITRFGMMFTISSLEIQEGFTILL